MKLVKFIKKFVEHNSLIRLVYKEKSGHKIVLNDWDDVSMEHVILKGEGKYSHYINHKVIGVTDILVSGPYSESINIVIEEKPLKDIRKEKLEQLKNNK